MLPHLWTNFEIQKRYQNKPRFNGIYSRHNIPEKTDGAYIINLDEDSDIGTHWVALYVRGGGLKDEQNNVVTYFDSFGVEHISKEIKEFIDRSLYITINIFRTRAYDSIIWGYFCVGFIDFMLAANILNKFTNLFSPNDFKKNDDIILKYFNNNV